MKKIIISILLGTMATSVFSQEILTLEKCLELALINNIQKKNADLSVEIAKQTKKETFTNYFPTVSATGGGLIAEKPMLEMQSEHGLVGMMKNEMIGSVMATQPLFVGGQIVNGNRLAKTGMEVSKLQKQMTENEVRLITERYFWQLVSLNEKMKTIENSEMMLNRIDSDVKISIEAGLTTRNNLLRVELEQNRLASGKLKAQNGLQMLKTAFAQHIGLEYDTFDVALPKPLMLENRPDLPNDLQENVKNRPEYKLVEKSVEAAKLQLKMEVGKNLPTVAVGAGYNYINFDKGRPAEMEKKFGMVFATVSIPLSEWWGGSHAIKRKKLELMQVENTKQEKWDMLRLQMQQVGNELNEAYQQILLARKSIASAEENLKISQDNFNVGVTTLSDLLEAQNLLQQSRDQYTEATAGYFMKLAEYKQMNE